MRPNIHLLRDSTVIVLVGILILYPSSILSKNNDRTPYYDVCAPFDCGGINFTFPFSDRSTFGSHRLDCGLPGNFLVSCDPSLHQPSIELVPGRLYLVKELFPTDRVVTVVDAQLIKDLSLPSFSVSSNSCSVLENHLGFLGNNTSNKGLYLSPGIQNLNFLICQPQDVPGPSNFIVIANSTCNEVDDSGDNHQLHVYAGLINGTNGPFTTYTGNPPAKGCRSEELFVSYGVTNELPGRLFNSEDRWKSLVEVIGENGVPLVWSRIPQCDECLMKNGRCGFEAGDNGGVVCFSKGTTGKKKWKIIVGVTTGCSSLIILASFAIKKRKSRTDRENYRTNDARFKDARTFIKSYQSTLLTSFSFKDIKKITTAFSEKLGEGGYGNVYKGKLLDGRLVAVKLLGKALSRGCSAHDGQDFINEVQTIGTIHHVNIIRLHGFCVDRGRQALVYEYMPSGSLGDVLRSGRYLSLGTDVMMKIAVGVAEGVNYLHQACDSRILHLDIKPQNILLDENYNPKVSDFGLAKMYSRSRSAITLSEAKGTIGFIAPEIIMRNLGNPSDRSDVYSFGMVLLEMVGVRKRVDKTSIGSSSSRERYFPDWIYDELNRNECTGITREKHEIGDHAEEDCAERKMIMIGLWCIQVNPRERPSMARVLEMLLGKVERIAMPPKPLFFASSNNLLWSDETESNAEAEAEEISGVASSSLDTNQ